LSSVLEFSKRMASTLKNPLEQRRCRDDAGRHLADIGMSGNDRHAECFAKGASEAYVVRG
jgi:hypothetical protein